MSEQSPPPPPPPSEPPQYNVYRSRKRLRDRFAPSGVNPMEAIRRRRGRVKPPDEGKGGITPRRVLKWIALAIVGWILVTIVVFFISAQVNGGVDAKTKNALSGGGSVLTGSNVLVLGSDERPKKGFGSKEPGANSGPPRSDSIIVMHVGFGTVRKLSILRDTIVDIPGHGTQKINAAYAIGGTPLTIKTVEGFLGNGLKINHVIQVSFTNFPDLIDALGGVDVKLKKCIRSNSFSGQRVVLTKGEHHLSGRQALFFSRVRKNSCAPNEDDRARAARQQQVLAAMRDKVASPLNWPSTFIRGPFVAWQAPQAIRSDMHGPGLAALFTDLLTGGSGKTKVLLPDPARPFAPLPGGGSGINVTPVGRTDAVNYLLGK
jgi:LCP family protein required for cell wall assembly